MRKNSILIPILMFFGILLFVVFSTQAQTQVWQFQGYAVGQHATGPANSNEGFMPHVQQIDGQYFLYFCAKKNSVNAIYYATSADLISWSIHDTVLTGDADTNGREYLMAGPRIVKTNNGMYRMFYRCSPKYTLGQEPYYHIRSAISADGIHYSKEGVRIEIQKFQPGNYFIHVGHSAFYRDQGGNISAYLTAKDTTMIKTQPDKIYRAVSFDEGLSWSGFTALYDSCHDPVVIRLPSGAYHAFFSYLNFGFRTAVSADGVNWPVVPDTIVFFHGTVPMNESSYPGVADLGAAADSNGKIFLYSNYHMNPGLWTDVAYFTGFESGIGDVQWNNQRINLFPNPNTGRFTISDIGTFESGKSQIRIFNSTGQTVYTQSGCLSTVQIDLTPLLNSGLYFVEIKSEEGRIWVQRLVILSGIR